MASACSGTEVGPQMEEGRRLTTQSAKRRAHTNTNTQHNSRSGKKKILTPLCPMQSVNLCKDYTLTCKYPKCSFSCSGDDLKKFGEHLRQCVYMQFKCPKNPCKFMSSHKAMKEHLEKCEFTLTKCPNENCNVKTERKNVSAHANECPYRIVSCKNESKGCKIVVPFKDQTKHLETCFWEDEICENCNECFYRKDKSHHDCPEAITKCPNENCNVKTERKNVSAHANECPYRIVSCKNECKGCKIVVPFKDQTKHLETCFWEDEICENCNECFYRKDKSHHDCPEAITKCPNENCNVKTERKNVSAHANECPYRIVSCKNECKGCKIVVPFKDQTKHLETCFWEDEICENCNECFYRKDKSHHDCPEAIVKCHHCGAKIKKSKYAEHYLIDCDANEDKIKCNTCKRYIKEKILTNRVECKQAHRWHNDVKTDVKKDDSSGRMRHQSEKKLLDEEELRTIYNYASSSQCKSPDEIRLPKTDGLHYADGRRRFHQIIRFR